MNRGDAALFLAARNEVASPLCVPGAFVTATRSYVAVIHREDDGYVSWCPELDVSSQGDTPEQARDNLREAVELFLQCASSAEIAERKPSAFFVTSLEVCVG